MADTSIIDQDNASKRAIRETINLIPLILESGTSYPSFYNDQSMKDGAAILMEIGDVVVQDFEADLASRQDWEGMASNIIKKFSSYVDVKTYPWPNCSNVNLPVVTISAIQFHARAYESLIPSGDIVKVINTGGEDAYRAERVQKYMNWQLLYKMSDFVPGMDKTLLQSPLIGSTFKKTFFSFEKNRPVSLPISALDIVYPYNMTSFEESPRKSHVIRLTKNDIRIRVQKGVFTQSAWDLGPGVKSLPNSTLQQSRDSIQGIHDSSSWYDTPRIFIEQSRNWDLNGDGIQEPYAITVDYETRKVVRITSRSFIDAFGQEIILDYFTPYCFLPNPEGAYGFGLGTLLFGLNDAMNSIVNEVIDAGSLANLQGGFVSKRSGVKKGDLKFTQGEFKEVDTYVDDIQKAIYKFDFKGPNQTLYATLGLLYEYAKMVSSISETMTGQMPASDTPATTIMALIEEGRKVYSAIYKRHHVSFGSELRKIYTLNSIFLNEIEYFKVLGDNNIPMGPNEMVGKSDFVGEYDIIPVSDPNILSRAEKILKAQQLVQDIRSNPLTAGDMNANYIATRRYYEALEIKNIDEVLPKAPVPVDLSPEEENSKALTEQSSQVLPDQDHLHHIDVHDSFVNSPIYGPELTPNAKNLMDKHHKEHLSALYMKGVQGGAAGLA